MRIICALILVMVVSASAENLIHNSSFECGSSGWAIWGSVQSDTYGNEAAVADHVVSTNGASTHGASSIYFMTRLWGRPMWLTNGTYMFTFDARASSSYTLNAGIMPTWRMWAGQNKTPDSTFAVTTSWKRFTNTVTVATNGWYFPRFMEAAAPVPHWIDSVQLEPGTNASAYAPGPVIEVGMDTADGGNNLFLSDAKTLRFKLWNRSIQTNATIRYDIVSGVWNTNIASGTISTNALAAGTNTTINLALPSILGDVRITCYVTNVNDTWDETSVAMFPYAAGSGRDTNGLLGIHAQWSSYHISHARRLGFTWNRIFSPLTDARWANVFPTLTTTNIYLTDGSWKLDYPILTHATNDLIPIIELTGEDTQWYPQTNASWIVMRGDYTNYVGRMVNRYKDPTFNVHHWEIWNEPNQNPRAAVALYDPAIYADLFTNSARLIKLIDSTATVIAFGGLAQASQGSAIWAAMTAAGKADADAVSFHFYPHQDGTDDPNLPEDERVYTAANFGDAITAFGGVKPIWNTETAVRDIGGYHGPDVAFQYPFYWAPEGDFPNEAWHNELEVRQLPAVDRITYNFCQTVGWGFKHFNIQYGRKPDDVMFEVNTPTIYEFNGTVKPWCVALLIANHFTKRPGLGRLTVTANDNIEAYMHTNTLGAVVPIWCWDRGSRTLTLSSASVALYDTMGNLIVTNSVTIPITRSVRYLVSGSLTLMQLSNAVATATVATNQDTIAPGLTIDFSPIGQTKVWGGVTNAFKATAIDERVMSYGKDFFPTSTATNVQYRWSLNSGDTWGPWSETNHFLYSFPSAGKYSVWWQAKDQANNVATAIGPTFGDFTPGPTNVLNVSGQMNVGEIFVQP